MYVALVKVTVVVEECNQLQSELNTIGNTSVEYLNLQNQLDLYKHKVEYGKALIDEFVGSWKEKSKLISNDTSSTLRRFEI